MMDGMNSEPDAGCGFFNWNLKFEFKTNVDENTRTYFIRRWNEESIKSQDSMMQVVSCC